MVRYEFILLVIQNLFILSQQTLVVLAGATIILTTVSVQQLPINYMAGSLVNISGTRVNSRRTYTNTINFTAQSAGLTYNSFSTPLQNNKVLLFLTSFFHLGYNEPIGATTFNRLQLQVKYEILTNQTYKLVASLGFNNALNRLHFSMIIFDQADVESSGLYMMIYERVEFTKDGGFIPFPQEFEDNFIIALTNITSDRTRSVIVYQCIFTTINGSYGIYMPPSFPPSVPPNVVDPVVTNYGFSYLYLKTWICPNQTFFDASTNLCTECTECPIFNCIKCLNLTVCEICNSSENSFLNTSTGQSEPCMLEGCVLCQSFQVCSICNSSSEYGLDYTSPNRSLCGACNVSCSCDGYSEPWDNVSLQCGSTCGDGLIRVDEECDDENLISDDGCSAGCIIQDGASCSGEPSICNTSSTLKISKIEVTKQECNKFSITVDLQSEDEISLNQISLQSNKIHIIKVEKMFPTQIKVLSEYFETIESLEIRIRNIRFAIPYSQYRPLVLYSSSECDSSQNIQNLFLVLSVFSYGILFASLLSLKIIGLELFGVLQLSYFTLCSYSQLQLYLQPLADFRFFNGFNIRLTNQFEKTTEILKYLGLIELHEQLQHYVLFNVPSSCRLICIVSRRYSDKERHTKILQSETAQTTVHDNSLVQSLQYFLFDWNILQLIERNSLILLCGLLFGFPFPLIYIHHYHLLLCHFLE